MADSDRRTHFFHGTAYDIEGSVLPTSRQPNSSHSVWGAMGHSGQRSDEHAFATTDEKTAWDFANQAHELNTSRHKFDGAVEQPSRPRVYEVSPNPAMRPGVYNEQHPQFNPGSGDLHEYVAPSFKVKRQIDIMPGHQGTFPNLNWNQFKHNRASVYDDMNHPSDMEISHGHGGSSLRREQLLTDLDVDSAEEENAREESLRDHPHLF